MKFYQCQIETKQNAKCLQCLITAVTGRKLLAGWTTWRSRLQRYG